jgi:hypothetical protein
VPLGDVSFAFGHHLDVHDGGEASLGTHDTAWNAKPFHQSILALTNTINNAGTPARTDHPAILNAFSLVITPPFGYWLVNSLRVP